MGPLGLGGCGDVPVNGAVGARVGVELGGVEYRIVTIVGMDGTTIKRTHMNYQSTFHMGFFHLSSSTNSILIISTVEIRVYSTSFFFLNENFQ